MTTLADAEDTPMPDAGGVTNATRGDAGGEQQQSISEELHDAMQDMLESMYTYRDENGHDPSKIFHKRVNKRNIPDYYDVIKEPMAMSNLKQKLKDREYKMFSEYVRDCALIWHNAFTYNRPESVAYEDAQALKGVMEAEIKKIADNNLVTAEQAQWPDLGEIPDVDEEGEGEEEEEGESGQEDDEDEDGADNSDGEAAQSRRRGRRPSAPRRGDSQAEPSAKRRGRPPKMLTPLEARIKSVLKGMKKLKYPSGQSMISDFEKLPDKTMWPEYFNVIRNPISLEQIKKFSKRKRYHSVDDCLEQLDLMFENAKNFNEANSPIYEAAVKLKELAHQIAAEDKQKPDTAFSQLEKVKPDGVMHNGQLWRIGDWVHIQNPNDATKPIVAQVYKIWEDDNGQDWINACWYYRPEQTVHHFEKHFWPNEVFKTSQYRDHPIGDLIDKCFVMFFTRYTKGRPRGLPEGTEVYVCEARYNEDKKQINKIKTWSSCLPNEVRDHNYELDLFPQQIAVKKLPTPLQHLVKDAKDPAHSPLPDPKWGADDAPPVEGGVFAGPRDENQSPPPPPTPPPEAIQHTRPPSSTPARESPSKLPRQNDVDSAMADAHKAFGVNNTQSQGNFAPSKHSSTPGPASANQYNFANRPGSAQTPQHHAPRSSFDSFGSPAVNRQTPAQPSPGLPLRGGPGANDHGPVILPDHVNNAIPSDVRKLFQQDDKGHVLFWSEPHFPTSPLQRSDIVDSDGRIPVDMRTSIRYRAAKLREKMLARKSAKEGAVPSDSVKNQAANTEDAMNVDSIPPSKAAEVVASQQPNGQHKPSEQASGGVQSVQSSGSTPLWKTNPLTEEELLLCKPEDILKIDPRRVRPVDEAFARSASNKPFLQWAYEMQIGTRMLYQDALHNDKNWEQQTIEQTKKNIAVRRQAEQQRLEAQVRRELEAEAEAEKQLNQFKQPDFFIEDVDPSYVGTRWTGPNPYGHHYQRG